jgi:hypothetical protein
MINNSENKQEILELLQAEIKILKNALFGKSGQQSFNLNPVKETGKQPWNPGYQAGYAQGFLDGKNHNS